MTGNNVTGTGTDLKNIAILIQALERFEEINNNGYQFEYVGYSINDKALIALAYNGFQWAVGVAVQYHENSDNPFTWAWGHYKNSKEDAIKEFGERCPLAFIEDERKGKKVYVPMWQFVVWRSTHNIKEAMA